MEDILGQRRIKIIRNGKRPGGQAKRSRIAPRRGERPQLGDRSAIARNNETLASLDTIEESRRVTLEFLEADGVHATNVTDWDFGEEIFRVTKSDPVGDLTIQHLAVARVRFCPWSPRLCEFSTQPEARHFELRGDMGMKIDSSDLDKIREAGLLVSLPFVAGHIAYPDGVVIGKPEGIGGNSTTDHRAKWSSDGPYLDAPTLYLHAEGKDLWFVSLEEYEPGPGPGDFRNKWSTPEEALADVMSFFFGDSTRMRKSC